MSRKGDLAQYMDGPWVLPGHPDYEQERVVRLSFPRELTPGEIYRNRLLDCGYSESRVMTSLEYDEMFEEEKRKKKAEAKAAKTKTKAAQAKARAAKAAKAKEAEAEEAEAKEAEAKDDGLHPAQQR
jgi:type IV secretory pathway VirB10-like protein